MDERIGIAGSGAIACGLAAAAARHGEVVLWARSDGSAQRARSQVESICGRLTGAVNAGQVRVETDLAALGQATAVVEAVAEDEAVKAGLLSDLGRVTGDGALLATTTSSLSIERLAQASGVAERFVGLHVFHPVPYLFSAVALLDETAMRPEDVDECMMLGAGHPMGPLALLDYVGLDVAVAIGEAIGADVPPRLRALVADGALGRKTGRGLYRRVGA